MPENHDEKEFEITRVFHASREAVWNALTQAESLAKWWGPKGSQIVVAKLEVRPGGMFHYNMITPDGRVIWGKFVYREINAPEGMTFVNSFSDAHGGITPNPWMPNWPLEVLNHLTLTNEDGETKLTLRGGPINATAEEMQNFEGARGSMQQGFAGTFEKLDEYLASL